MTQLLVFGEEIRLTTGKTLKREKLQELQEFDRQIQEESRYWRERAKELEKELSTNQNFEENIADFSMGNANKERLEYLKATNAHLQEENGHLRSNFKCSSRE